MCPARFNAKAPERAAQPGARIEVHLVIVGNTVAAAAGALVGEYNVFVAHVARGCMAEKYAFSVLRHHLGAHEVAVLQNYHVARGGRRHYAAVVVEREPRVHADELLLLDIQRQRLQLIHRVPVEQPPVALKPAAQVFEQAVEIGWRMFHHRPIVREKAVFVIAEYAPHVGRVEQKLQQVHAFVALIDHIAADVQRIGIAKFYFIQKAHAQPVFAVYVRHDIPHMYFTRKLKNNSKIKTKKYLII